MTAARDVDDRAWWQTRRFACVILSLTALPLLYPPIPPLLDVPGHMARYHVMLRTDPGLATWYHFGWRPIGYLGADLLVAAAAPLIGLAAAVKAVAIAIPVLGAAGILWLSREAHGRVQPYALFALPFVYHFAFLAGFLNFTLAMALVLNALALWLRLRQHRARAPLFVAVGAVIWTAHLFGWIALGVCIFGIECGRRRDGGERWPVAIWRAGLACLPLAPPVLMFLLWHPSDGHAGTDWWQGLSLKPGWLAGVLRDRWAAFDIGSTALVAMLLYRAARDPVWRWSRPVAGSAVALTILFILLPFGSAYLDARVAPHLFILALVALSSNASDRRTQARWAAIGLAFFLVRTAGTTASLAIESRDWSRRLVALDHLPRRARVAALVANECPAGWHPNRLNHLPSLAIVRRGAFANDQFVLGSTGLMTIDAPWAGRFATDPSQVVTAGPCAQARGVGTLAAALQDLPRDAFDHLWLIDPPAGLDQRPLAGWQPVWSDGRDVLLRRKRLRRLSDAAPAH